MNKKYLVFGVVILVIALLVLAMTSKRPPAPTIPEASIATQTVTYTNEGFSPAELVVKSGTTITFLNQSDSPLWVASAVHPTHLLYPEFDAKRSIPKGASYSFTFMKPGEHPYHNHVLLGKYGKIVVQ